MTDQREITVRRDDLVLAFNALVRSYNSARRRGPGKQRPSTWTMAMVDRKDVLNRLGAALSPSQAPHVGDLEEAEERPPKDESEHDYAQRLIREHRGSTVGEE